jgi:hypothetical protein
MVFQKMKSKRYHRLIMAGNAWRHGLVKADHYRPIEETNLNSAFINYTACYKLGGI